MEYEFKASIYSFEMVNGQPKIVISQIQAFDKTTGKFIKNGKLEKLLPLLSNHQVSFKPLKDEQASNKNN